jgi:hypothetical protein
MGRAACLQFDRGRCEASAARGYEWLGNGLNAAAPRAWRRSAWPYVLESLEGYTAYCMA